MGFFATAFPSLVLGQAVPALWLMLLWLYLAVGIPGTFAVASVGFISTFSNPRNTRDLRLVHALALFASLVNTVGIIILVSSGSNLVSGDGTDQLWGGIFIVTVILSLLGWWRVARRSR